MTTSPVRLPLRFFWVWILGGVLLVFMVKPVFHLAKIWRAESYARSGEEFLAKGDLEAAQSQAKLSLELHSGEIRAVRVLARVADQRKDAGSHKLWLHIVQSAEVTDADRLALAEAALRASLPNLAEAQRDILLSRPAPTKEVYHLAGLLAVRQQQGSLAREWFARALSMDPGYAKAEINLAQFEVFLSNNADLVRTGLARLRRLGEQKNEAGLESLRSLVLWGNDHPGLLPYDDSLADQLRQHPLAQMQDQCLAADWKIRTEPERQKSLEDSLIALAQHGAPSARREVAIWLNRHRNFEKTIAAFPLDPKGPDELVLVQLDALAALGRWGEIRDFLAKNVLTSQPVLRSLYRGRVARELGNNELFNLNWSQAVREAGKNPVALRYLAEYAEKLGGQAARAAEVYETLSEVPAVQSHALLKLVRLYEQLGQTRNLLKTLQRLLIIHPNNPVVLNDVTYLELLLNETSVQPFERARQVYAIDPRLPAFATTYALARLKSGSAAEALRIMSAFSSEQFTAPGWQSVHAAILAANGRKEEAVQVARRIDLGNLKPEEKLLIADFWPPKLSR